MDHGKGFGEFFSAKTEQVLEHHTFRKFGAQGKTARVEVFGLVHKKNPAAHEVVLAAMQLEILSSGSPNHLTFAQVSNRLADFNSPLTERELFSIHSSKRVLNPDLLVFYEKFKQKTSRKLPQKGKETEEEEKWDPKGK